MVHGNRFGDERDHATLSLSSTLTDVLTDGGARGDGVSSAGSERRP